MFNAVLLRNVSIASVIALMTAACGTFTGVHHADRHLVPDEPGLYALVGEDLQRLDGPSDWEVETWDARSTLPVGIEFVVRHPGLEDPTRTPEEMVQLRNVAWVRSQISADGEIMPVSGSRWGVPASDDRFIVPMTYTRVADRADTVRAVPQSSLQAGLYSLQLNTDVEQRRARLGVNWQSLDQDRYAANYCVDRYVTAGGGGDLYPCEEQEARMAGRGLQVHLVNPRQELVGGVSTLRVQGVVINNTQRTRRVPPMTAELRDAQGQVLHRWQFTAARSQLQPGESVSFETEANPPAGTSTVHVNFGELGPTTS